MEKVNFMDVMRECIECAAIVGFGAALVFLSLTAYGAMAQFNILNSLRLWLQKSITMS